MGWRTWITKYKLFCNNFPILAQFNFRFMLDSDSFTNFEFWIYHFFQLRKIRWQNWGKHLWKHLMNPLYATKRKIKIIAWKFLRFANYRNISVRKNWTYPYMYLISRAWNWREKILHIWNNFFPIFSRKNSFFHSRYVPSYS